MDNAKKWSDTDVTIGEDHDTQGRGRDRERREKGRRKGTSEKQSSRTQENNGR